MTVAIPDTAEGLAEFMASDERLGELLTSGQLPEFNRQYCAKMLDGKAAELGPQMREQMQLGQQQALQAWEQQGMRPRAYQGGMFAGDTWPPVTFGHKSARAARAAARSRLRDAPRVIDEQHLFNARAIGASLNEEEYAGSLGQFSHAVYMAEDQLSKKGDTAGVEKIRGFKRKLANALSERIPAEGGFLVPEDLRSEILMVALETAVVRPRARLIPMDSLRVPLPAIDDTSHASSVYGGVVGYWTEEGAALTTSAPSFGRVVLEAKKLTAYTTIPNELLQDSVTPLDVWFSMFFPKALAWFEDIAFIGSATTGTGAGEPQGFLNSPAAVKLNSDTTNKIDFVDVATMYSRMWPASLNSAVWLCSPDALVQLLQLAVTPVSAGTTQSVAPPGWLTQGQAIDYPGGGNGDGVGYRLMGRPLIVSEKMPSSGSGNTTTSGALTFVDLDYYLLGDRQSMQIASSADYLFANDLMAYRVIERLDGRFWLQSAITPANGSTNTLSPLVLLDTPHA
jgi:HK97 family phage major capsid protein